MTPSRWRGGPPPWWPEGTEWPPKDGRPSGLRRRFVLVIAFAFFGLLILIFAAGIHWDGNRSDSGWDGPPIFGFVFLGIGILIIVRFLRRTAAPIGAVMEAAERVAAGDYATRIEPSGPREVRRLATTFNEMTSRLEANEEQRRRLLADVTHELRTPLSIIRGNVEGMLDGVYPRDDAHLSPIVDETKQMARLLDDLHTLATAEAGALQLHREATDIGSVIAEVVSAFKALASERDIELSGASHGVGEIELDPVRIRQVLENVIANALRYTPPGGTVLVAAEQSAEDVTFTVEDTGPGVAQDVLPHLFDRFTKSADSGGSGLGLAIARSLVEAHGGTISAELREPHGLRVRIVLPFSA
jgi:signal transduction histidine kinase